MTTPILDFLRRYAEAGTARLHMPGHKGRGPLGCEKYDITEIAGADDLSCPEGIIAESEKNASALFGTRRTFYSTEGSSQCVKAMLLLAARRSKSRKVLAGRNAHKSFLNACALLDLEPVWLSGEGSLCSAAITPQSLRERLEGMERPCAVYITSPDYLGNMLKTGELAAVCRDFGLPLLLDGAHGAYLDALKGPHNSCQPDLWCASAHKTLGVLTGGAYLHVSEGSAFGFEADAREALSVFGSSSPSYLILASLDAANGRISSGFADILNDFTVKVEGLKARLAALGLAVEPSDPLRITIAAYKSGRTGFELAEMLRSSKLEPEFADEDYIVLMLTPDNNSEDLERIFSAFSPFSARIPRDPLPLPPPGKACMTPREALLSPRASVEARLAEGRILASAAVSCPPAIPIAVMGERLTREQVELLPKYGVEYVDVVLEK